MLDLCSQNSVDSPLLRLPIDVRKRIYEYVFNTGKVIELLPWEAPLIRARVVEPEEEEKEKESKDDSHVDGNYDLSRSTLNNDKTKKQNLPTNPFIFLLTSRQIYQETRLLPFSCNTVHCGKWWDLCMIFSYRLSPAQIRSIRVLKIRWPDAQLVGREYAPSAALLQAYVEESSRMAKQALQMLHGVERIIVDCEGYCRMDLERRLVDLRLQYACSKYVKVSFEVIAKKVLMSPRASTCGLGLTKWKCFYGKKDSVCKAGKCDEGVPLYDLVANHVSIPTYDG